VSSPAEPYRVAVYYAPAADDPLWQAGTTWLGRDPETGAEPAQPPLPGIAEWTADARHYGFHATLKPPMRLAPGRNYASFAAAARKLAAGIAPFDLPPLAVADTMGFLALRETMPCPPLQALADLAIAALDDFRAPPEPEELVRRRRNGLSPAENAMLTRYGYPYAFGTWFFHMTISRRLSAEEHGCIRPPAEAHFAPVLASPRRVTDLALFAQAEAGAPFVLAERITLRN
jgi:putative phosphonate metabolism protein